MTVEKWKSAFIDSANLKNAEKLRAELRSRKQQPQPQPEPELSESKNLSAIEKFEMAFSTKNIE